MKLRPIDVSRGIVVLLLVCTVFLVTCSSNSSNSPVQAAQEGLTTLNKMALASDPQLYGYESASDVGNEDLGEPIEVKTIDLDALVKNGVPGEYMIVEKDEYLFPVLVRGKPIGSIQIMVAEDQWEYVATRSKAIVEKALEIMSANALNPDNSYLLDVEELELSFVGFESDGRNILIPLFKNDSCSFVPGSRYEFMKIADEIKSQTVLALDSYDSMVPPDDGIVTKQSVSKMQSRPAYSSPAKSVGKAVSKAEKRLNVELVPQSENQWCWAATGRMTMLFAGGDSSALTQCAQANDAFSQSSCCANGSTGVCNKPYYPLFDNWGFAAEMVLSTNKSGTPWEKMKGAALSWTDLKGLIDAEKPVAFLWRWKKGGGHYMVAVGYYEDLTTVPETRMVHIINPLPQGVGERQSVAYDKWIGGPAYTHLQTCYFYNIAQK